jgi:hypothetical protein
MAAVRLGLMAVARAVSPEGQRCGQRIVTDHSTADQELMAMAQAKAVAVHTDREKRPQETAVPAEHIRNRTNAKPQSSRSERDH